MAKRRTPKRRGRPPAKRRGRPPRTKPDPETDPTPDDETGDALAHPAALQPPPPIPADFRTVSHSKKRACLSAFALCGNIGVACQSAGISRKINEIWRREDQEYARLWEMARDNAADILEAEAIRRAYHGTDEPVFQMGRKVGTVRRYSDTLLIFMLKGARPEKFGDPRFAGGATPVIIDAQQLIIEYNRAPPLIDVSAASAPAQLPGGGDAPTIQK